MRLEDAFPGSATVSPFETAKELFEDVIGALGLDADGAGRGQRNRIGKSFFQYLSICAIIFSAAVFRG
jgi:hypothetical protein